MKNLVLLILCSFSLQGFAQSEVLEAYVAEGLQNGFGVKSRSFDTQIQGEKLEQAKGLFLPDVGFEASYLRAQGGRTIDIPIGDLFNPVYAGLNGLLPNDPYPTNLENVSEQFLPDDFHETKLVLRQPLFNPQIHFNKRIQESLLKASEASEEAYKIELAGQIRMAYYQYLQALEAQSVYQNAQTLLEAVKQTSQSLVRNQKALSDAVYNADYELSKNRSQLARVRSQIVQAQTYFNFLLNRESMDSIEIDTLLYTDFSVGTLSDLRQEALQTRAELKQLDAGLEAAENGVALSRYARLPELGFFAEGGFQGFGYTFDSSQDYFLLGLSMRFDIFQGGRKKSQIREATLERQKLENQRQQVSQQIDLQTIQAYQKLLASQQNYESAKVGIQSAERSFAITKARYRAGNAISLEFLDAQTRLTNAQLSVSIAKYEVLQRYAEVLRATGK